MNARDLRVIRLAENEMGEPNKRKLPDRPWTTVANAVDAYRRRLLAAPEAHYEHLWRLIHVHEALVVTLGSLTATRVLSLPEPIRDAGSAQQVRRRLTQGAETGDDAADQQSRGVPCLTGSLSAWIDFLKTEGTAADPRGDSSFLAALREFLTRSLNRPLFIREGWRLIATVPEQYEQADLPIADRFAAINSLRNKLAHVPFPFQAVEALHLQMRRDLLMLVLQNYRPELDSPYADIPSFNYAPVLRGRLATTRAWICGSDYGQCEAVPEPSSRHDTTAEYSGGGERDRESWPVDPLLRIGPDLKASLLFKMDLQLLDELESVRELSAEYHRFGAEAAPHQKLFLTADDLRGLYAASRKEKPAPEETEEPEATPAAETPSGEIDHLAGDTSSAEPEEGAGRRDDTEADLRQEAEAAFRQKDYRRALEKYEALAESGQRQDRYNHVAKSRHGGALWRTVVLGRSWGDAKDLEKLERATRLLQEAAEHQDPGYRARSHYELSKVLWHRSRKARDRSEQQRLLEEARVSAFKAATESNEWSYISWCEKVQNDLDRLSATLTQGESGARPEGEE